MMSQSLPRITLRMQLALLYAGFLTFGAALLLVPILTIHQAVPEGADGRVIAGIQANTQAQEIRAAATLIGLVALSLVAGWLIAGRFLRPLRTITATARHISASNLNQRLALTGRNDEFKDLGETLDSLFERLEASFESQRHFVANASHELRTPLAAERTLLQVALADPEARAETLRETCQQVLVLGDQQERLIEALLTLASSERGVEQWEPFDLAEVTAKVVADRSLQAAEQSIHVQTAFTVAPATGDPNLVESLVANLVDNALRHNVPRGRVEVWTTMAAGRASIRIRNTGPVVPQYELDRLFQPFQQLGHERIRHGDGYGLGLAIARAIAIAHKAALTATARSEGGLDIEVSFP
ncbi:MAG: HAMP domain-containing sensor histidine kinase [Streptosporangiaceae bacterium]